jgi:hypothetical protein
MMPIQSKQVWRLPEFGHGEPVFLRADAGEAMFSLADYREHARRM